MPLTVARLKSYLGQQQLGFDLLRIYLGIGLVVRGIVFLNNPALLSNVIDPAHAWALSYLAIHAVAGAHLVGGVLLSLGCYTRFAAAVQVPAVMGALLFIHLREGLFSQGQALEFSALVLVLLLLYVAFGSGSLSVDRYLDRVRIEEKPLVPELTAPLAPIHAEMEQVEHTLPKPPPEPLFVRRKDPRFNTWLYRDAKLEMTCIFIGTTVLFVLLAQGRYDWSVFWFLACFITFGVWRIGRAEFQ